VNHFRISYAYRSSAAISGVALVMLLTACSTLPSLSSLVPSGERYEYVHTAGVELGYNMPYTPAISVNSGKTVYFSGITAAPIYHSHPHIPSEFDHLDFSATGQAEAAMENLKATVEAAGGQLSDIVQMTRFMVDQDANQDAINVVMGRHFGEHRPAGTSVEIPRLATGPRFILELEAVAIVPE
jgi:enamine deaminase RidA (YjgF/YER057c/UK114 family)